MTMNEAVAAYCAAALEDYLSANDIGALENDSRRKYRVYPDGGTKYLKLVVEIYGQRSVFGFIVNVEDDPKFKYGDLLKAANWKAPAKNFSRGNIFDPSSYDNIRWTGIN